MWYKYFYFITLFYICLSNFVSYLYFFCGNRNRPHFHKLLPFIYVPNDNICLKLWKWVEMGTVPFSTFSSFFYIFSNRTFGYFKWKWGRFHFPLFLHFFIYFPTELLDISNILAKFTIVSSVSFLAFFNTISNTFLSSLILFTFLW